jgi:ankyrin repeat protein
MRYIIALFTSLCLTAGIAQPLYAQTAPDDAEIASYRGLLAAVAGGKLDEVKRLIASGADLNAADDHGRTPLMIAGYRRDFVAARLLIKAGADLNKLDVQRYDLITISAVADHVEMVKLAITSGGDPRLVTSPYDGTALIAAAHLGHVEVVQALIDGGAPLDHVNNLEWTALIESIVLGDGGPRHVACLSALVKAGANVNFPDGSGVTPLGLASRAGYTEMVRILEAAGARQ